MLQISQAAAAVGPPSDGTQLRLLTLPPPNPGEGKGGRKAGGGLGVSLSHQGMVF